jgi:hypothetical protein
MAPRSMRFGVSTSCFGRHVKPLVQAAFSVVSTHQPALVSYGPFSLCVIHKEGLCPSSGDINRLMMMMIFTTRNAVDVAVHRHLTANCVCNLRFKPR